MKRKLVKQGEGTLMISLPRKWTKANNLDKGDEINLEEEENKIIVTTDETTKKIHKATINVSGYAPLTNVVLISLYIKGVDELEITFDDPKILKDYQKRTINELIGFEIVKQTSKSVLLKDITGEGNQDIDELVQRLFFILDSMAEELVEAIEKKHSLEQIIDIDASINKFANFCLRILNKRGYKEQSKSVHMYGIVKQLEEIGDVYKEIAQEIAKTTATKQNIEIIKESRQLLKFFKEALLNYSQENAVKLARKYEEIKKQIANKNKTDFLLSQLNDTIISMNHHLLVMDL